MIGLARLLLPCALLALLVLAPAVEAATLKAKTSVTTKSGATRMVVKLTSDRKLGDRKRPRKVKVKAGGETYKLSRARGASAAAVKLGTWRSEAYRGSDAQELLDLAGDKAKVIVKSRAGTTKLGSKVKVPEGIEPAPDGGDPTPDDGGDPAPIGDGPPDPESGDITGQEAIDRMTAELSGGFVRRFNNSGDLSETFELHLCEDGRFRYYAHSTYIGAPPVASESFGDPWTVVEALIKGDGSYAGARVQGTFTYRKSTSGEGPINEPAEAIIEYANGQWYWNGNPVEAGLGANCESTL